MRIIFVLTNICIAYIYSITGSMAIMMIGVGLISKFTIDTPWSSKINTFFKEK